MLRRGILLTSLVLGMSSAVSSSRPPLDWIAGYWCMQLDDNTFEEFWLPPHKGLIVGVGRSRSVDLAGTFEYLRIVDKDGVWHFIAQPGGEEPSSFVESASGAGWIRFENPNHDFPQRVEYRRNGDRLLAEIAGPGPDGDDVVLSFDYRSCNDET